MIELGKATVNHKTFGKGSIKKVENGLVVILFKDDDTNEINEKKFVYPDAFRNFLKINDPAIAKQVDSLIKIKDVEEEKKQKLEEQEKREKRIAHLKALEEAKIKKPVKSKANKANVRKNIAFKLNFCDGGQSSDQIGFNGICSDALIKYNIEKEKRISCTNDEGQCCQYFNGTINRETLDDREKIENDVCYESQLLKNWTVLAGEASDGKTRKIKSARRNSLAVLTTRLPSTKEAERIIFGVFLIDEVFEGNDKESGYVTAQLSSKMILNLEEAKKMNFWKYYANADGKVVAKWGSGLFRYMDESKAIALLKDLEIVLQNTPDAQLAKDLLETYCKNNLINLSAI
ncbi:hypothetical protein [Acetobacterium woodii]|uniref:Uncharacterized protein n=1 Tax=Acetobacterium woodii (strain ATCC 29683 / DSM 1030 / JCM 2381 / KCTC 1655 / WB1) TaxID=931626 RepID=H6LH52_ACEWD|nr:hypothetical protein [Acetobacterium woodii]AFA48390.1 hypothetical protein Awo_c16080 [Acetobacterium woodii DSM 1030]